MSTVLKCENCGKEYKIDKYYVKHVEKCLIYSDEEEVDENRELTPKEKRIKEIKEKEYKNFKEMSEDEIAEYKKEQLELMKLMEGYHLKKRERRKRARVRAKDKARDEDARLKKIRDKKPKPQTKCHKCGRQFPSNSALKIHFKRKTPCELDPPEKLKPKPRKRYNASPNNYSISPIATVNKNSGTGNSNKEAQMKALVASASQGVINRLNNLPHSGKGTHTRQTVNQLNARSVKIIPPSQEDLDMVVNYMYKKIMREFEDYKRAKLEKYRQEMLERQRVYIEEQRKKYLEAEID